MGAQRKTQRRSGGAAPRYWSHGNSSGQLRRQRGVCRVSISYACCKMSTVHLRSACFGGADDRQENFRMRRYVGMGTDVTRRRSACSGW